MCQIVAKQIQNPICTSVFVNFIENSSRRKQEIVKNLQKSKHRGLVIKAHQLLSILKDLSAISIDVEFGQKPLHVVYDKNNTKQHKFNENSLLKIPKLEYNQPNRPVSISIPFSAW